MVSIITVNYNGYKDTCEFIESLCRHETCPYEIIVVDNASRNNDGERLKEKYPGVTVVCSKKNLGFAGGNNLGYPYAKGEYILYMNNDMTIDAPFLQILINRLNSSKQTGLVSPKIKYAYAPDTIQYAGFTPLSPILLRNHQIGHNQKDHGQYDFACETAYAHGACMLTSRKILEEAGTMTDIYFLFYEELDWSRQLQRAGYNIWYEPAACVYHKESISVGKGSSLQQYYMTRSRLLYARRNLTGMNKFLSCLYQSSVVLTKNLLSCLLHADWQLLRSYAKGTWHGLTDSARRQHLT